MNIHEYQAKALLKDYGVPVAEGVAITSADAAEEAARALPGPLYVVKSQIHAGGRGKGKFKELGPDAKGGVRLARSVEDVVENATEMLGKTLVTKQTGPRRQGPSTGFISRTGPTSRANCTCRSWSTARPASPRSWSRPKGAWTSRPSRTIRPKRSSLSGSIPMRA